MCFMWFDRKHIKYATRSLQRVREREHLYTSGLLAAKRQASGNITNTQTQVQVWVCVYKRVCVLLLSAYICRAHDAVLMF